jgi:uncharacterized protein
MAEKLKAILEKGNAAVTAGNYEGFVSLCTEDTEWTFIGDRILKGKEAVREWMQTTYLQPPKLTVTNLIAEGEYLTATGEVSMVDKEGKAMNYAYCDIWRFRGEKIVELRAFVIPIEK